jgi:LuxR family quorum sensing-dependent transcriptional regulator
MGHWRCRLLTSKVLLVIEGINRAQTSEEVTVELERAFSELGVKHYIFNILTHPDTRFKDMTLASRAPQDFLDWANTQDLRNDAAIVHVRRVSRAFSYDKSPIHGEKSRAFMDTIIDFNLAHGVMVPVPGQHGSVGYAWMADGDDIMRLLPVLEPIAISAFYRLRTLVDAPLAVVKLSEREREILKWTALGKTAWDIGEILQISNRTVEWHIAQSMKKLGAVTRTQAVILAIQYGLLHL